MADSRWPWVGRHQLIPLLMGGPILIIRTLGSVHVHLLTGSTAFTSVSRSYLGVRCRGDVGFVCLLRRNIENIFYIIQTSPITT